MLSDLRLVWGFIPLIFFLWEGGRQSFTKAFLISPIVPAFLQDVNRAEKSTHHPSGCRHWFQRPRANPGPTRPCGSARRSPERRSRNASRSPRGPAAALARLGGRDPSEGRKAGSPSRGPIRRLVKVTRAALVSQGWFHEKRCNPNAFLGETSSEIFLRG